MSHLGRLRDMDAKAPSSDRPPASRCGTKCGAFRRVALIPCWAMVSRGRQPQHTSAPTVSGNSSQRRGLDLYLTFSYEARYLVRHSYGGLKDIAEAVC